MNVLKTFIHFLHTTVDPQFFSHIHPLFLQSLQSSYKEMATGGAAGEVCDDGLATEYH